jgi:hypothetical protein
MTERSFAYGSGYLLALVAAVLLLLIIPAASASARRLKPAWRAWVWPLVFAGLALTSLSGAVASMLNIEDNTAFLWKGATLFAGLSFTFLTLNALYRAIPDTLARRFAPLVWAVCLIFGIGVLMVNSFIPVLIYDAVCSVLVFLVYSTLYARDRDRAADAKPIMVGTAMILLSDLIASFEFTVQLGPVRFDQLLPFNVLEVIALVFFYIGASASYSVKYDLQRSRERALSGQ